MMRSLLSRKCQKCLTVRYTARNSLPTVLDHISMGFRALEKKVKGRQAPPTYCCNTVPTTVADTLTMSSVETGAQVDKEGSSQQQGLHGAKSMRAGWVQPVWQMCHRPWNLLSSGLCGFKRYCRGTAVLQEGIGRVHSGEQNDGKN